MTSTTIRTKICSGECGQEKPMTTEYFRFRNDTQNYNAQCKVCVSKKDKAYKETHKEEAKIRHHKNLKLDVK